MPRFTRLVGLLRILLGIMFLASAIAKGADLVRFGRQVEMVLNIQNEASPTVQVAAQMGAGLLAAGELVVAALLLAGCRTRSAAIAAGALLTGFILVILYELATGRGNDCGCFGAVLKRSPSTALLEDSLALAATVLVLMAPARTSTNRWRPALLIFIIGSASTIVLGLTTPGWATLHTGSQFAVSEGSGIGGRDDYLVWLLDPHCQECQTRVPFFNAIASTGGAPKVVALSNASEGRLTEFQYDFKPIFPIRTLSAKEWKHIFLPTGTVLYIGGKRVKRIIRPGRIPDQTGLLMEALGR